MLIHSKELLMGGGEDKGLMDIIFIGHINYANRYVLGEIKPNQKIVFGVNLPSLTSITGVIGQTGSAVRYDGSARTGSFQGTYETTDGKIWYRYGDFSGGDIIPIYCFISPDQQIGDTVVVSSSLGATVSSDGNAIIEDSIYGQGSYAIQKKEVVGKYIYRA